MVQKLLKANMKAIDPSRIESLELVPADKAKEFFPELDNNREVLFVTTDDSDAGKKLKGKNGQNIWRRCIGRQKKYFRNKHT